MDTPTALWLSKLTSDFYQRVNASFAATRQAPWQGWEQALRAAGLLSQKDGCAVSRNGEPLSVLDLACGNLRFERYLASCGFLVCCHAYDNCDELVQEGTAALLLEQAQAKIDYHHLDIAQVLLSGQTLSQRLAPTPCSLSVCFGFMHHVPLASSREQVLQALVDHTCTGGHVIVSFWQFANSKRIMAKAQRVGTDEGDYLLGWQGSMDVRRYCHSFAEAEIDALVASCAPHVHELARFSADGKEQNLNRYLALRVIE
ncbi:MAG: class I SAM-dependent methyltransferase [Atopobiaceae bacterium]|nr:class I SAM-dependent methyltransferase [Atopobiaceae bacterium]